MPRSLIVMAQCLKVFYSSDSQLQLYASKKAYEILCKKVFKTLIWKSMFSNTFQCSTIKPKQFQKIDINL